MKISKIRAVEIEFPETKISSQSRQDNWNSYAPRVAPLNKYSEFSRPNLLIPGTDLREVWVQVIAEDGTWGLGLCDFGEPCAAYIDYFYAPLLEGRNSLATELLNDLMFRATQKIGYGGIDTVAQSGIDLALWDLKGKLLQQPVYSLIGGPVRDSIKLYATSDDLEWSKELGFESFKVSNPVHYEDGIKGLDILEDKIGHAREIIGTSSELMFNPVMSFNVEFATRVADRLKPFNLRWLEEPLMPNNLEGHIQLKKNITHVPLATGEHHHGRISFRQLIENRAVDVIQPDIKWCGGLSEMIKIYTLAEAAGIITVPHTGGGHPFGQHFSIAMPESPIAEYWMGSDPGIPLEETRKIPGMSMPKNGQVRPSNSPGFGLEIPEDWITPWDHSRAAKIR